VPEQHIRQPQQFSFDQAQNEQYQITVKAEENPTAFSVAQTLIDHYKVGDVVEVSAPLKL